MSERSQLETIVNLARCFGNSDYVVGGGGNVSVKDEHTLWIKPSGTTLVDLRPEQLVALSRERLRQIYNLAPPADPQQREALVQQTMAQAVCGGGGGRPSVESPLHETFEYTFVVHTHPAAINGMTCGLKGERACRELFPDALWLPYTDPGYTLCLRARREMAAYAQQHGRQPNIVFIQNHGVFVAADTESAIRSLYSEIVETMAEVYAAENIATELAVGPKPSRSCVDEVGELLRRLLGSEAECVAASGPFPVAEGPLTPDHIVYEKSFPLLGEPTPEKLEEFRLRHGYYPRIIATERAVFSYGVSEESAALALEMAQDGALVVQLAAAFGGPRYLDEQSYTFIERWEAESYRRKLAESAKRRRTEEG
ncbi:MAG: class II aldolase/adducin family protein [Planctomycetota bacterium]|nr:class II aldolase/adducin family protein [Planctomycetota bacterium]